MKIFYDFKPLDKDEFRDRVQINSSASFLTMVSIIQGVAFYILVGNSVEAFSKPFSLSPAQWLPLPFLIYPLLSFTSIVVVYFLYSWFISITYRAPNFHETLIPFLVGLSEILPMENFNHPKRWWGFFALFIACSILALFNTIVGLQKESFGKNFSEAYDKSRKEEYGNIVICAIVLVVAIYASWSYPSMTQTMTFTWHDWVPFALTFGLTSFLVWKSQACYLNQLYKIYKLSHSVQNKALRELEPTSVTAAPIDK